MYRVLSLDKDSYITDKQIAGSGSITSNVGQAGTLDLFKIWSSGSTPLIENSRLLVHVDLDPLRALTGSSLNIGDSSFKAYLSLKTIYGGQTTPSNFKLTLLPLAKAWDEGRGLDVKAFRDLDAVNWVTASVSTGTPSLWALTGANSMGNLPNTSVDVWVSGNLGAGSQSLEITQTFTRGDEDLLMDVTTLVSATLAGIIPDNGWRIAFTGTLETDENSYFVKRFGSRHTTNPLLHPKLITIYGDAMQDDGNSAFFGPVSNKIRTYNSFRGSYTNFVSGVSNVTGTNCAKLVMVASRSISVTTSSFFTNFSASVTYTTSSTIYYSSSFSASQTSVGAVPQAGFYEADVVFNPQADAALSSFLTGSKTANFQTYWYSNDGTVLYSSGSWITFGLPETGEQVVAERNFVANVTNLKPIYVANQTARLRFFVQDRNVELPAFRLPTPSKSLILKNVCWRLLNAHSREVVIPFHSVGTKLAADGVGMYFDMYMQDLSPNKVYELEFQITENDRDYHLSHEGWTFKVVP